MNGRKDKQKERRKMDYLPGGDVERIKGDREITHVNL